LDRDLGFGTCRDGFGKGDLEELLGALGGLNGMARNDFLDLQVDRVEAPLLERFCDGLEVEGGGAGESARLEVGRDVELQMRISAKRSGAYLCCGACPFAAAASCWAWSRAMIAQWPQWCCSCRLSSASTLKEPAI
jgi:hypothetical protein